MWELSCMLLLCRAIKHLLDVLKPHSTENGGPLKIDHVVFVEGRGNLMIEYAPEGASGELTVFTSVGEKGGHIVVILVRKREKLVPPPPPSLFPLPTERNCHCSYLWLHNCFTVYQVPLHLLVPTWMLYLLTQRHGRGILSNWSLRYKICYAMHTHEYDSLSVCVYPIDLF